MSQQWTPPPMSAAPANVPNYLILSILSLFCLCWPLSIAAIIFAAQVNGKVAAGDIEGAMAASKKAKLFSFIAIGCGLVLGLIWVVMMVLGFGLGAINS